MMHSWLRLLLICRRMSSRSWLRGLTKAGNRSLRMRRRSSVFGISEWGVVPAASVFRPLGKAEFQLLSAPLCALCSRCRAVSDCCPVWLSSDGCTGLSCIHGSVSNAQSLRISRQFALLGVRVWCPGAPSFSSAPWDALARSPPCPVLIVLGR